MTNPKLIDPSTNSESTLSKTEWVEWVLRIAVFGSFFGHGVFALQGKEKWVEWVGNFGEYFGGFGPELAIQLLFVIGIIDILVALIILVRPVPIVLLWAVIWGFWTAVMRPLPFIGEPIWDFVKHWPDWGAPLALLLFLGWPKNWKEWLR